MTDTPVWVRIGYICKSNTGVAAMALWAACSRIIKLIAHTLSQYKDKATLPLVFMYDM